MNRYSLLVLNVQGEVDFTTVKPGMGGEIQIFDHLLGMPTEVFLLGETKESYCEAFIEAEKKLTLLKTRSYVEDLERPWELPFAEYFEHQVAYKKLWLARCDSTHNPEDQRMASRLRAEIAHFEKVLENHLAL